jgi:hypothetical protein
MGGLKKGTGSLNFENEEQTDDHEEESDQKQEQATSPEAHSETKATDVPTDLPVQPDEHETVSTQGHNRNSESQAETTTATSPTSAADPTPQGPNFDMNELPYLVQRQMRGASVNADRTNQLLLEVRHFVKDDENTFLNDLRGLVDGPVYKGDAREAAMIVAQENPELVAEKLREWGIEYLDK